MPMALKETKSQLWETFYKVISYELY